MLSAIFNFRLLKFWEQSLINFSYIFQVALNSLENLMRPPLIVSRVKPLIAVILKLLGYCTKILNGRQALTNPSLNSVQYLLPVLQLCLENDLTFIQGSSGVVHLTDQVLEVGIQKLVLTLISFQLRIHFYYNTPSILDFGYCR